MVTNSFFGFFSTRSFCHCSLYEKRHRYDGIHATSTDVRTNTRRFRVSRLCLCSIAYVLLGLWMLHIYNNPLLWMFIHLNPFIFSHIEVLTSVCARVHRISHDISLSCVRSNKMHALCKAALLVVCAAAAAGD